MATIFGIVENDRASALAKDYGTPLYLYSESFLHQQARKALSFPAPFGLTVRYAMKALPTKKILQLFHGWGLQIDASSYPEVLRARKAGIPACDILLTAQEFPPQAQLDQFIRQKGLVTASSLNQLELLASTWPGAELSLRFNPGIGTGQYQRVNVGGSTSGFGIWHEDVPIAKDILREYGGTVARIHTHIGSGTEEELWKGAAELSLKIVEAFPSVRTINLGGGFKVARLPGEKETDMHNTGKAIEDAFIDFYHRTDRRLHLEIEPGTFLTANGGALLATIIDVKATDKYNFIVVDSGMTEVLRPALYGAQHQLAVFPHSGVSGPRKKYVVVGHCCESGDLWTPAEKNPEALLPRELPTPEIGNLLMIGGAGAYCSGMNVAGYNSFPSAAEVLIRKEGTPELIRRRQTLEQLMENEV